MKPGTTSAEPSFGSTVYCAVHAPVPGVDYIRVVERLLAAGAKRGEVRLPTGRTELDAVLGR